MSLDLWEKRSIVPASLEAVQTHINGAYAFAAGAEDKSYGRGRGAEQILNSGRDYAELPGFAGRSPRKIISSLPAGSKILDVGCGYGQLGSDIKESLNLGVDVFGYDAQAQKGQERLSRTVIGNIDDLSPDTFGGVAFSLIVSSALLYHLPDYWGAILRMSGLLRADGILLASTMPRVIRAVGEPVDDASGLLTEGDKGDLFYFRNRNVFSTAGEIIPPGKLVNILNQQNTHFKLEYSLIVADHISGVKNVGGQLSGQRMSGEEFLNLSNMFYCLSGGSLGYVIAQTEKENQKLREAGFVSVPDRLSYQNVDTSLRPFL